MKLQRKLAVTVIATAALVLSSSPAFAGQINVAVQHSLNH
jgi:hypothetical protein